MMEYQEELESTEDEWTASQIAYNEEQENFAAKEDAAYEASMAAEAQASLQEEEKSKIILNQLFSDDPEAVDRIRDVYGPEGIVSAGRQRKETATVEMQQAFNYMTPKVDGSAIVSAAIAGNAMKESGMNARAVHDNNTGYGLFGHRLDRRDALLIAVDRSSLPEWQAQLDFTITDLKLDYPGTYERMQNARTAGEAAIIFMTEYERPNMKYADPEGRAGFANSLVSVTRGDSYMQSGGNNYAQTGKNGFAVGLDPLDPKNWKRKLNNIAPLQSLSLGNKISYSYGDTSKALAPAVSDYYAGKSSLNNIPLTGKGVGTESLKLGTESLKSGKSLLNPATTAIEIKDTLDQKIGTGLDNAKKAIDLYGDIEGIVGQGMSVGTSGLAAITGQRVQRQNQAELLEKLNEDQFDDLPDFQNLTKSIWT